MICSCSFLEEGGGGILATHLPIEILGYGRNARNVVKQKERLKKKLFNASNFKKTCLMAFLHNDANEVT